MGLLTFAQGFEGLGQGFYRHGLDIEAGREFGLFFPVPANPNPAPLDYGSFRGIINGFVIAMDRAEVAFQSARDGDYVVPVDLMQLRLDLNGDGTAADDEMIGGLLLAILRMTTLAQGTNASLARLSHVCSRLEEHVTALQ